MTLIVVTRSHPQAGGLRRYYTGVPCRRGHDSERITATHNCVECAKLASRKWRVLNPEYNRAACLKAYKKYRDIRRAKIKSQRQNDPEKFKRRKRKARGQIEPPTRSQPKKCECCERPLNRKGHEDHDHKTGLFRGWLCGRCNPGIGLLGDDLKSLTKAVDYLKRNA